MIKFVAWLHKLESLVCSSWQVVEKFLSSSFINCLNLSSTKGQFLNSCPSYWQYAHVNVISMVGYEVITSILRWTSGCSMVPITSIFDQTPWVIGCVCQTTTCIMIASTGSTCYWKLDQHEGLCSKLHNCSNRFKSWLHSNFESIVIRFKIGTSSNV